MQNEDDQIDRIQHYLITLRKKVDHQIKDPFGIHFANFAFEDLNSWKNNVLQLDATSRLYGQRVDFLHCGTLQILGSVLHSESSNHNKQPNAHLQKSQTKKLSIAQSSTPLDKNLQNPDKISNRIETFHENMIIWREVCKKRDTLNLLMLNDVPINKEMRLSLFGLQKQISYYQSQKLNEESALYLKLLNFQILNTKSLQIYKQIQNLNIDLYSGISLYKNQHKQRKIIEIDQYYELDFNLDLQIGHHNSPHQWNQQLGVQFANSEALLQSSASLTEGITQQSSLNSQGQSSYFEFDNWKEEGKSVKRKLAKKRSKRQYPKQKKEERINFSGIHPFRKDLFPQAYQQEQEDKFLLYRDYLLLKFIKYTNPFHRKIPKNNNKSKFKPIAQFIDQTNQITFQPTTFDQPTNNQIDFNNNSCSFVGYNEQNTKCSISKRKFKEAVLPIKEMKRKIRQELSNLKSKDKIHFNEIKNRFMNQQALDLFITILHIAAEQQKFVTM